MRLESVSLSRIAWGDRRFVYTRGQGGEDILKESIRRSGLLAPPDLLRSGDGLVVIRGSRRLRALRALGRRRVEARVYAGGEITPLEAWEMNFFENLALRPLNRAEACTAVAQLRALGLSRDVIVGEYFTPLDLPPRRRAYDECLAVASLPGRCLDALARGEITFAAAAFLSSLGDEDLRASFRFLRRHRLSYSQQREWARLVGDISARDRLPVRAVLAAAARSAVHRAEGASGRGSAALQALRERRYPALADRRRAFGTLIRTLKLPPRLSLAPHPTFECPELNVRFTARSAGHFRESLRRLEALADLPGFARLLDPGGKEED